MHKLFTILSIFLIILLPFSGCKEKEHEIITSQDAKAAIAELNPEAIILECEYNEDVNAYIIEFKTFYATYEGIVNANTGTINSIVIKEEEDDTPMFDPEPEEVDDAFISPDTALAVALSNSGAEGTAVIVKNELDAENKVFNIIFRSVTAEYYYTVDAVTGDILSMEMVLDS